MTPAAWLRDRRDEARLAFMLLSRLPMGRVAGSRPMGRTGWAFPLVGTVLGGLAGLVHAGLAAAGLPPAAAALAAVGAAMLLSGAMHEDGLADTLDGFGGGRTPEGKLEIMKDSRIGTFGVAGLVVALGLRVTLIAAFANPWTAALAMTAAGAVSRAGLPALMAGLPAAGPGGLGRSAMQGADGPTAAASAALGLVVLVAVQGPAWTVPLALALLLPGLAVLFRRQIGGITGDTLGFAQVSAEVLALALLLLAAA